MECSEPSGVHASGGSSLHCPSYHQRPPQPCSKPLSRNGIRRHVARPAPTSAPRSGVQCWLAGTSDSGGFRPRRPVCSQRCTRGRCGSGLACRRTPQVRWPVPRRGAAAGRRPGRAPSAGLGRRARCFGWSTRTRHRWTRPRRWCDANGSSRQAPERGSDVVEWHALAQQGGHVEGAPRVAGLRTHDVTL